MSEQLTSPVNNSNKMAPKLHQSVAEDGSKTRSTSIIENNKQP